MSIKLNERPTWPMAKVDRAWFDQHPDRNYRIREFATGDQLFYGEQEELQPLESRGLQRWLMIKRGTRACPSGHFSGPASLVPIDTDEKVETLFDFALAGYLPIKKDPASPVWQIVLSCFHRPQPVAG